jgi:hypothetical protein
MLLDNSAPDIAKTEAEQYTKFDLESRCAFLYKNYRRHGQQLAGLCFYEYVSQIFVQTFAAATGCIMCFLFKETHPQHITHVQVSVNFIESLATPSLCGSFIRL